MADTIIPVAVRTARTGHTCAQCRKPILPGDRYEDHRLPPYRDVNESPRWWPLKVHAPQMRNDSHTYGCDMAAAYREQASRLRATALAWASMPIGPDLGMLEDAARVVVNTQRAECWVIQRKAHVGFVKAGRLLLLLEEYGVIGPARGGRHPVLVPPWDLAGALFDLRQFASREQARA
jgi:hypothetical protein